MSRRKLSLITLPADTPHRYSNNLVDVFHHESRCKHMYVQDTQCTYTSSIATLVQRTRSLHIEY